MDANYTYVEGRSCHAPKPRSETGAQPSEPDRASLLDSFYTNSFMNKDNICFT